MLAGVTVVGPAVVSLNFILFMGSKTFVIGYIENISISPQALECILKTNYIEYFTFNCKLFENLHVRSFNDKKCSNRGTYYQNTNLRIFAAIGI